MFRFPVVTRRAAASLLVLLGLATVAAAQDPPPDLDLPSGQHAITLPPDGILRYGTVGIHTGAEVTFVRNLANTPVQILAEGAIVIESGAALRLDGQSANGATGGAAGPGGFAGGNAGPFPSADGDGPGSGQGGCPHYVNCGPNDYAGNGAFGCDQDGAISSGTPYGNPVLLSLIGGSGGGGTPDFGGAGGGGAILLSSAVSIHHNGTISAAGGDQSSGGRGSGGAIRLRAPLVAGTGTLDAHGFAGNHGRIRIDGMDRSGVAFTFNPACAMTSGSIMVETATTGSLRITAVGGKPIAENAEGPVFVSLDGADPKTVSVRANGFGGILPIEVALTPDNGPRQAQVVNADMDTADQDGNVVVTATFPSFPTNQAVRVDAWTR